MSIQSSVNQVIGFVAAGTALRAAGLKPKGEVAHEYEDKAEGTITRKPANITEYKAEIKRAQEGIKTRTEAAETKAESKARLEQSGPGDEYVPQTPEDVEAMAYQSANPEAVAQNKALMATQNAINEQHRMKDVARRRISDKMPKGREAKRIKSGGDN